MSSITALVAVMAIANMAESSGSICLPPVPDNRLGDGKHSGFQVRIDDGGWRDVPGSAQPSASIGDLSLKGRRLVSIRNRARILESFYFEFADYDTPQLCLWYKDIYGTWSLTPAGWHPSICAC